jgi:hypothetical protein
MLHWIAGILDCVIAWGFVAGCVSAIVLSLRPNRRTTTAQEEDSAPAPAPAIKSRAPAN